MVYLGHDFLCAQRREVYVPRTSNVVEQQVVVRRAPPRKQAAGPQSAQRAHPFRARVQTAKARQVLQRPEAVGELNVLEGRLVCWMKRRRRGGEKEAEEGGGGTRGGVRVKVSTYKLQCGEQSVIHCCNSDMQMRQEALI